MRNQVNATMNKSDKKDNLISECAIMTLTPTKEIFPKLRELSENLLKVTEDELNKFLDNECLTSHTVPVCIPLLSSPDELNQFIKENSEILIDFMLSAWPFPLNEWGYTNKNQELLNKLINITYYPVLCKAIAKPVTSTLDLAVTLVTPKISLTEYIVDSISSKKMELSEEELIQMEFMLSAGIAVITNQIEKSATQDNIEFYLAINESKSYLTELKDQIVKTLFYFYFKNSDDLPREIDNQYLNQWFNTKTYIGMYFLPNG
jgi:hypothetical protein